MNKPFKHLNDRDPSEAWFEVGDPVEVCPMDDDVWVPGGVVTRVGSPRPHVAGIWYWLDGTYEDAEAPWPLHRIRPAGCTLTWADNGRNL